MNKIIKQWPVLLVIIAAFLIGFYIAGGDSAPQGEERREQAVHDHVAEQTWTCSMHPQIRQPKPGKCPICAMDLVPITTQSGDEETGVRELKLSTAAVKLAEIQVAPVQRRAAAADIRLTGKVEYDETRVKTITSRVPGRIDKLYVDYTGMQVHKGDRLVLLYSPELITAQQELLQALSFKNSTVESVREKLRLWGVTPGQIKEIETSGKVKEQLTIYSPISGIVVHKEAAEGLYVNTGARIYTIADLSHIWIKLDAYESDIAWLRNGQTVTIEAEAYPGEIFTGKISFIEPVLNPRTRTMKIRVNVANPDLKLKPEMFIRAVVQTQLTASGKVPAPGLTGKGLFPLVIPASAPLLTGKRAVVYVKVPGKKGVFAGKEVVLGAKTGAYYIVKEGLTEGEQVVVNGAFKIDSDLQIRAKPSMMNPVDRPAGKEKTAGAARGAKIPAAFQTAIDDATAAYFDIQHALSSDSADKAKKAGKQLLEKLDLVDKKQLSGQAHMDWMNLAKKIRAAVQGLTKAGDIEAVRVEFEKLTQPITIAVKRFGSGKIAVLRFHCPMAFNNKGAYWLQNSRETRNPYFGALMLLCKDSVEPLIPDKKK
jgi:Cu(I)/Ag(I) efflux system membrane fusion protein